MRMGSSVLRIQCFDSLAIFHLLKREAQKKGPARSMAGVTWPWHHPFPQQCIVFGKRSDHIRGQLGDLIQHWKQKDKQDYQEKVFERCKIEQSKATTKKAANNVKQKQKQGSDSEEESNSSLTDKDISDRLIGKTASSKKKPACSAQGKQIPIENKKKPEARMSEGGTF